MNLRDLLAGVVGPAAPMTRARRDAAMDMLAAGMQGAGTSGSPLLAFLAPLAGGVLGRRVGDRFATAQEGRDGAAIDALLGAMGGGGAVEVASTSGAPRPAAPSVRNMAMSADGGLGFPASLIGTESGGRWDARNEVQGAGGVAGHDGRLQFGHARLQEAMAAGALPAGTTREQFRASPGLQRATERWHFADIDAHIDRQGLARFMGQDVNGDGVPETRDGMRAVAHLGGKGGLSQFLRSGGRYDPADANGTRLSDYARIHAGNTTGFAETPGTAPGGGDLRALLGVLRDEEVSEPIRDLARSVATSSLTALMGGGSEPVNGVNVGGALVNPRTGQVLYEAPREPSEPRQRRIVRGPDGNDYYEDGTRVLPDVEVPRSGVSPDEIRQVNVAIQSISDAIRAAQLSGGLSPEEARAAVEADPLYAAQWEIVRRAAGAAAPPAGPQPAAANPDDPLGIL